MPYELVLFVLFIILVSLGVFLLKDQKENYSSTDKEEDDTFYNVYESHQKKYDEMNAKDKLNNVQTNSTAFTGKHIEGFLFYIQDNKVTISDYINDNENVEIPCSINGVKVMILGHKSFFDKSINKLLLPDTVHVISPYAFTGNKIFKLDIPRSVNFLGVGCFSNNEISNLNIPNSVTNIESKAFESNNLTNVTIPGSVSRIGHSAFKDNSLSHLVIEEGVKHIGDYSFSYNNLTAVTIPSSVISIGVKAFYSNNLKEIRVLGDKKRFNRDWELYGFPNTTKPLYSKSKGTLHNPETLSLLDDPLSFKDCKDHSIHDVIEINNNQSKNELNNKNITEGHITTTITSNISSQVDKHELKIRSSQIRYDITYVDSFYFSNNGLGNSSDEYSTYFCHYCDGSFVTKLDSPIVPCPKCGKLDTELV